MEVSSQLHTTASLITGMSPQCPLYRRLGEPWSQSGFCGVDKNLIPIWNWTLAVQPITCCYNDWAIPVPLSKILGASTLYERQIKVVSHEHHSSIMVWSMYTAWKSYEPTSHVASQPKLHMACISACMITWSATPLFLILISPIPGKR
jgi:hypothetical protein